MDTVYMKERAYRLVETVRRDNQREQRLLEEKLFSKAGLAASHQMEMLALTEQTCRVKQELTSIKKSSSTTWGVLPPRSNDQNPSDQFVPAAMGRRGRRTRRVGAGNQRRIVPTRRPQVPGLSRSDIGGASVRRHHSDPGPAPSPVEVTAKEQRLPRPKLDRRSLQQWDRETRRAEHTLRRFNEAFPFGASDFGVRVRPQPAAAEGDEAAWWLEPADGLASDSVDGAGGRATGGRPPGTAGTGGDEPEAGANRAGVRLPETTDTSSTTVTLIIPVDGTTLPQQESIASVTARPGADPVKLPPSDGPAVNRRGEAAGPSVGNGAALPARPGPISGGDLQDARRNVARRLGGNQQTTSGQRPPGSPHGFRPLSPIREQRTDISLTHYLSLPEIPTGGLPQRLSQSSQPAEHEQPAQQAQQAQQTQPAQHARETEETPVAQHGHEGKQSKKKAPEVQSGPDVQPTPEGPKPQKEVQKKAKQKGRRVKEEVKPTFDSYRYNPDGSVRTMHQLPNFTDSLREAMKARYLRFRGKQWFEQELQISEIFAKD